MTEQQSARRLVRREEGRLVGGVCSGLAEYFDASVVAVRFALIVLGGALLYGVLFVLLPDETDETRTLSPTLFWTVVLGSLALQLWAISSYL